MNRERRSPLHGRPQVLCRGAKLPLGMWTSQLRDHPRDIAVFSVSVFWSSLTLTESHSAAYVTRLDLWSFLSRPTFSRDASRGERAAIVALRDRPHFLPPQ